MVASIGGAIARTLVVAIAVFSALPAQAASFDTTPWPVEGRAALLTMPPFGEVKFGDTTTYNPKWQLGGEAEFGPRDGFWSVGGSRYIDSFETENYSITTLYGRAKWRVSAEHTLSLVAGWNHAPRQIACLATRDGCEGFTPYGLLVAASWAYRAEHFWINLTPQYVMPLYGTRYTIDNGVAAMVPWVEFGWRITPNVGLGFRLGPAPIKLSFDF